MCVYICIYYVALIGIKKGRESSTAVKREKIIEGARKCHSFSLLCGGKQSSVLKAKFNGFPQLCYCEIILL